MSVFKVELKKSVEKEFKKFPVHFQLRLLDKIMVLKNFPEVSNVKKLKGNFEGYRLRVGRFRVLFVVDWNAKKLVVYEIVHRKRAYK